MSYILCPSPLGPSTIPVDQFKYTNSHTADSDRRLRGCPCSSLTRIGTLTFPQHPQHPHHGFLYKAMYASAAKVYSRGLTATLRQGMLLFGSADGSETAGCCASTHAVAGRAKFCGTAYLINCRLALSAFRKFSCTILELQRGGAGVHQRHMCHEGTYLLQLTSMATVNALQWQLLGITA